MTGHWHESVCACYRTDSRDCHTDGCFAEPGQRDWVERVGAGEYDGESDAQAEREEAMWAVGIEALMLVPHE